MGRHKRLFQKLIISILHENVGKRILILLLINLLSTSAMFYYCIYTNSMALTAFAYLSIFNILRLISSFVSIWVQQQKPNFSYSYGYDRFEVLSVFVCTAITQLSGFFIFKESFERLIQQDKVIPDSQIMMVLVGTFVNILVTYGFENVPFASVSRGASSNWIQDAIFDVGKSICGSLPLLSRFLLVRLNPYMLLSHMAGIIVIIECLLVEYRSAYEADTVSAMIIAILICLTMYPLSHHCAMILMHAAPKDLMTPIDKCLKEANTLDGLLEFRKEHFWTVSFGKYAGSLHVRVRRDANEQLILAQLTNKLAPYLHHITIQIFKDDWKTSASSIHNHAYDIHANLQYVSKLNTGKSYLQKTEEVGVNGSPLPYSSSYQTRPPYHNMYTPQKQQAHTSLPYNPYSDAIRNSSPFYVSEARNGLPRPPTRTTQYRSSTPRSYQTQSGVSMNGPSNISNPVKLNVPKLDINFS